MSQATLTLSSKNYSSWSLRGWLLCRMAGLDFTEVLVEMDDEARQELLLLSPSVLVPRLTHKTVTVWDTLAIAEYLHEISPKAGLWPKDLAARARCRSVSGEMHSGFHNLRSALPMNLKARHEKFKIFSGARPDVERVKTIWTECLEESGAPGCSDPPRRWPTPCTRRSAPASAPTPSIWNPISPLTPLWSCPGRYLPNGPKAPSPNRTKSSSLRWSFEMQMKNGAA